jgi:hypothetical protein
LGLFVRDILCGRIEFADLAGLLRLFRTNYDQNELVNKTSLIFNEYCDLFSFRAKEAESGLIRCHI